jgi:ABC-type bacteriocin/lantibiotic exporter with double-glycine peptidase domain
MQFYIQMAPQIFSVCSAIVLAAKVYPFAVILFLSLVPIILSVEYFEDRASKAASAAVKNDAAFAGKIGSAITCRKAIRAYDAGEYIKSDMEALLLSTQNTHFSKFFRAILTHNFMELSGAFFSVVILVPIGVQVLNGRMDLGAFTAIQMASLFLYSLGMASSQTLQFSGAIQAVKDLMDDSLDEEPPSDQSSGDKIELSPLQNSVTISGIKFRYNPKQPDVLKSVDASIDKGTYSVICGESGSGKTTVLNLLMRFRKPYEGSIQWDGTDIFGTSLQSFRKQVSVMFQDTMIYQTTIRENITFGLPDVPGYVEKAARDAEIAEVIERLPDKYDTIVGGDSREGLSGGQQQRICLARALYKKPSVLLLDEG